MENLGWTTNSRPGYRLKKLEVTNWGTFDSTSGKVFSLVPDGRTSLLVGKNGSGKSTLVDALLTLLVQPGVRNYNVAAGAKKRERDERTYIRGACGRLSREDEGSVVDYLRPDDRHYSVVLACFERAATGDAFTLAQVLQITGDGEVDKTYAFSEDERSIANDLSGLSRSEKIRKQLISRGFKATTKYSEYHPWFAKFANLRPKAMDVFNQTVAVKDIQSLNRFIRDHMLEAKPWKDKIESLLSHFSQLSQAHQALVKARRQIELLQPIESASQKLQQISGEILLTQQQLDAIDSYIRKQTITWLNPRISGNASAIEKAQVRKDALQKEIDNLDDAQRRIKNEIESTGGARLRELPLQIDAARAKLSAKKSERTRLLSAVKLTGLNQSVSSPDEFASLPKAIATVQEECARRSTSVAEKRLELAKELTQVRTEIEEEGNQLRFLQQQPGNLPEWLGEIRRRMADQLGLSEDDLPFACELISVADDQFEWQPVIETVLKRFALTMLVSDQHYRQVSKYVETEKLVDSRGRGQKLVYSRITEKEIAKANDTKPVAAHTDSLTRKLKVQRSHPLASWLQAEILKRYDFRCCDSIEQFQRAPGLAVTRGRHIKYGLRQHEKDDRAASVDSKKFVLGWDNADRLKELHHSMGELRNREADLLTEVSELESASKQISKQLAACDAALAFDDFDAIDVQQHQSEIEQLESEQAAIEQSNDAVRLLRERLEETIERRFAAQKERDEEVAMESNLLRECDQAQHILEKHDAVLEARKSDGSLEDHELMFEQLEESMASQLATIKDFSEFSDIQNSASQALQIRLNELKEQGEPLRADVIRAMQKFLSDSPEERDDLRADLQYMDGFLGLLEQLRRDDLPKYENRFQERLNEKVSQELGLLNASLQCEKQEILSKIDILNSSLEQLEYRAGTFMKLEPRDVSDREIKDFQALLRECLSDEFNGNKVEDETRFGRIEKLIRRLREEERWRDKVTDVRRWFDFLARELDSVSGQERSCYEDSAGQSGGEKAKLAFTILVAAIAYQFDIDPSDEDDDRFHFVVVDEMFSKVDDSYAEYALQLFEKFGLQLLIVAPLDAKAKVTEPYVGCYLHTVKHEATRTSEVISLTAGEYEAALMGRKERGSDTTSKTPKASVAKPR